MSPTASKEMGLNFSSAELWMLLEIFAKEGNSTLGKRREKIQVKIRNRMEKNI